eukprot:m.1032739 g.1032739  ORF g.1032739 m.1032739 type:complete len:72 (+) comp24125_c0_seq1:3665-3880(+)
MQPDCLNMELANTTVTIGIIHDDKQILGASEVIANVEWVVPGSFLPFAGADVIPKVLRFLVEQVDGLWIDV